MKPIQSAVFLLLTLLTSPQSHSTSWLDEAKSAYEQVKKQFIEKPEIVLPAFPTDMPKEWRYSYFNESVFNSQIAIMQTGFEHKESILLVHGLGQLGMQDWYSVIPHLAKKYHVITLDLPGFGYSERPQGRYSPTHYAHVLKAVVNEFSKDNLTVMGHSMGGAVSLRFASTYPELLNKLILVDVAGILQKSAFIKHTGELPLTDSQIPEAFQKTIAQVNDFSGAVIEKVSMNSISEMIEKNNLTWMLIEKYPNLNAAFSLVEEDFSDALPKITAETLIIWGDEDRIAPLRTGKLLVKQIEKSTLTVIEGAAHVPMKTHNALFLNTLDSSKKWQEESLALVSSEQDNLTCKDLANQTYSGSYNTVNIENCSNIELIDVTANQLVVIDSLVNAENLILSSNTGALTAIESVIKITNGLIQSEKPLKLTGSRLDVAGIKILASQESIAVDKASTLIFSISYIEDKDYQGYVHGTYQLKSESLFPHLK